MKEDGFNAGQRSIGRFFLMGIPLVLGLGASTWLGVWIGIHQWKHELSQEDRAAMYVGAMERPNSKIKIEIQHKDCAVITRADLDGGELMLYAQNNCHEPIIRPYGLGPITQEWHYQMVSPDGTILHSGYSLSCPSPTYPGDKAECRMTVSEDDRTATLRVWLTR